MYIYLFIQSSNYSYFVLLFCGESLFPVVAKRIVGDGTLITSRSVCRTWNYYVRTPSWGKFDFESRIVAPIRLNPKARGFEAWFSFYKFSKKNAKKVSRDLNINHKNVKNGSDG